MTVDQLTLSPAQLPVAEALRQARDTTVAEIVTASGVSKSTVAKTLVLLENAGLAARTTHSDGNIRLADTWSPAASLGEGSADALPDVPLADDEGPVSGLAASDEESDEGDTFIEGDHGPENTFAEEVAADVTTAAAEPGSPEADEAGWATDASATAEPDGTAPDAPNVRLASGALAQLVTDRLAACPEAEYTPTMLSHLLGGRSAGAIHNALERMCAAGTATRTCDAPKRYRYAVAPATDAA